MNCNLTDIELSGVRELIASHFGLHFPFNRTEMLNPKLASAAREFGFKTLSGFLQWLVSTNLHKDQLEMLASHLIISETYFWREPNVFTALTDSILPELINSKKKRDKSIRIWCAGCSTGEEAYSIAIALHKTIPVIKDWEITIFATDINVKSLTKANKGVYGTASFRNSPSWLKSCYFESINTTEYKINPEIKKMVTFLNYNLIREDFITNVCGNQKADIIFCRNVLMYFTDEWATKVSKSLYNSLTDNGWLVVSSCELSSGMFPKLTPVNFPGAVLYHKGKVKSSTFSVYTQDLHCQISANKLPSFTHGAEVAEYVPGTSYRSSVLIKGQDNKIKSPLNSEPDLQEKPENQSSFRNGEDNLKEIMNSIRLLADKGFLTEALISCNEAIASYKLIPGLYLLRASILQESGMVSEAIKSLKQSIYIDPGYIMGHFTLGNLFLRQGNTKNAKRYFNIAIDLLTTFSDKDTFPESEGLSVEYIRSLIFSNLNSEKLI